VAVATVPTLYEHPHDPDDSHYVNLALAAGARLVVSRDRDLLNLMETNRPEGEEFRRRFPELRILDPVEMLRELRRE
jgi:predicted nucleic acid-binding protein